MQVSSDGAGTATYRSQRSGNEIVRTYVDPSGATTIETYRERWIASAAATGRHRRSHWRAAGPVWGMAAPILTPEVETRPGGVCRAPSHAEPAGDRRPPTALSGSVTTIVNGTRWVQTFDPSGRSLTLVDPGGRRSVDTYDQRGRLLSSTAPETPAIQYTYDSHGRVERLTVGLGASAQTTHYLYDAVLGDHQTTLPDGHNVRTTVDANGNPNSVTDPDGSTTVDTYDADGRLVQVQPPDSPPSPWAAARPGGRRLSFPPRSAMTPPCRCPPTTATATSPRSPDRGVSSTPMTPLAAWWAWRSTRAGPRPPTTALTCSRETQIQVGS